MERASCWHLADRKVEVGAADGSSRQERVRLVITLQLEAEENLSTMATLFWAEGVWVVTWKREQQKAWWKQIFEVQIWRQVRGLAGAVMCETRDLGTQWPKWHTVPFEGQVAVDMRVVCPQDVKHMLLKQARMVCRKRWAAKHECEELKEGVWLELTRALL